MGFVLKAERQNGMHLISPPCNGSGCAAGCTASLSTTSPKLNLLRARIPKRTPATPRNSINRWMKPCVRAGKSSRRCRMQQNHKRDVTGFARHIVRGQISGNRFQIVETMFQFF